MSPQRIQRKRTKGWRMPDGAIYVGRPSKWGNPFEVYRCTCCGHWDVRDENGVGYLVDHDVAKRFRVQPDDHQFAVRQAVGLFRALYLGGRVPPERSAANIISELRGHDLACWCPLDQPCHADVLLQLANGSAA